MASKPVKKQNFRDENLRVFQQRLPQMSVQLQIKTPGVKTAIAPTPSGSPCVTFQQNGHLIHLHSAYDPIAEARYWAEAVGKEDWQIGVIFGFGLGYHLQELRRLYPERSIIVVEPLPDIFNNALQVRDLREVMHHSNFSIVLSDNAHAAARSLFGNHLRSGVIKGRVAFLTWPPYQRVWSEFWQTLQQQVGELTRQASVNIATFQYFSMQWQENFFTNLRASVTDPSVKALFPLFAGKPAILVSAGPSLQKNIHLLNEAKEKALIVAAGSAIGPLLAHGIRPHLVVSIDGAAANYYVFANIDTQDIVLLYSTIIYPRIIAEYKGPRFALGVDIYPFERWFYEQIGQDRGMVASGPSVANLTWDLLRQMECDPIIFVGQDLAFSNDGKSHAVGRVELDFEIKKPDSDLDSKRENDGSEWVEDVWGNQVRTRPVWLAMKSWFEQRIRVWGKGRTFIDATEGGAKIAGTQIMTLQEALDTYCHTSFAAESLIREVHQRQTAQLAAQPLGTNVEEVLKQIGQEFEQILCICDQAEEPLRLLDEMNRNGAVTVDDLVRFHALLSQFDAQLSTIEAYKQFVTIAIVNSITAFSAMSIRLTAETDLAQKGRQLVELYAALFGTVRQTVLELKSYYRLAADNPAPYAPPSLAQGLEHVSGVCDQMQPRVDRLSYLAQLPMDEAVGDEATLLHGALDGFASEITQTEIMRWFAKEILEKQPVLIQQLEKLSASVNRESDLKRKIEYLAGYHALFLHLVKDSVAQIRTYSQIPV